MLMKTPMTRLKALRRVQMRLTFPDEMHLGIAQLAPLLTSMAHARQEPDLVPGMLSALPASMHFCACYLDAVTGEWRYDYPIEMTLDNHIVVSWPSISPLYSGLLAAFKYLTEEQLGQFKTRLSDPKKHHDQLAEMLPVVCLSPTTSAFYELAGSGDNGRRVDWTIRPPEGREVRIEVKNRVMDLVPALEQFAAGERSEDGSGPEPRHDFLALLRGVAEQLPPRDADHTWQGAWIRSHLRQDRRRVTEVLGELAPGRFDFIALGGSVGKVSIVGRSREVEDGVVNALNLRRTDHSLID